MRMKYTAIFHTRFRERPYFTIRDARLFLSQKGISSGYLRVMIHSWLQKGKLHRLGKGVYTFHDELDLAGFVFQPFYYGLHFALTHHGIWDQATNPVVVTTKLVRPGIRVVLGQNVLVRRIAKKLFFGFALTRIGDYWLPVSDVEKTFLDMIYFRQKMTPEVRAAFQSRFDKKRLQTHLRKFPRWVQNRVPKILAST